MKWLSKIGRHCTSYQIVLPKNLIKKLGWQFTDVVVITEAEGDAIRIETIDNWVNRLRKEEEEKV